MKEKLEKFMDELYDNAELRNIVEDSSEILSNLFRALAHEKRIEIMGLLLPGEQDFSLLLDNIEVSKTTLAKHLNQLLELELIERVERGTYRMTRDGYEIFGSLVNSYKNSQKRFRQIQKSLWDKYKPIRNGKLKNDLESYMVDFPASYPRGWLSYISCFTGALNSLRKDVDCIDVAGYSGYAFFMNVAVGITDPSSPTYIVPMNIFYEGMDTFGWRIKEIFVELPRSKEKLPIKVKQFQDFFNKIKEGLKRTQRPVILWGIPIPEFGIVNGFKGNYYVVNTLRSPAPEYFGKDKPIKFDDIISPGRLQCFLFEKKIAPPRQLDADNQAIQRSIDISRINEKNQDYISGPAAFEEWANTLEGEIDYISYHGNSYIGECMLETAKYAQAFIKRLYKRYENLHLKNAFESFQAIEKGLEKFEKLFPFSFDGDLGIKKRREGAKILRNLKPFAHDAFDQLKILAEKGLQV